MRNFLLFVVLVISCHCFSQNLSITGAVIPVSGKAERISGFQGLPGQDPALSIRRPGFPEMEQPSLSLERSIIQLNDSMYEYVWDTASETWNPETKITHMVYDENFNLTGETHSQWDTDHWRYTYALSKVFDEYNKLTNWERQTWNGTAWVPNYRFTITYNENQDRESQFEEHWESGAWENTAITTYTYDSINNLTSMFSRFWSDSVWKNRELFTFIYDEDTNNTSQLIQLWHEDILENRNLYTFTYDENHNRLTALYQDWDSTGWVNYSRYYYTYDANSDVLSEQSQLWYNNAWANGNLRTFTYDENRRLTFDLLQDWHEINGVWINWMFKTYTYNANGGLDDEMMEKWHFSEWIDYWGIERNFDENQFLENATLHYWDAAGRVTLGDSAKYYFHTVVGIGDEMEGARTLSVYPNPVLSSLNIDIAGTGHLVILNLNGQQMLSRSISDQHNMIDVSRFSPGVYIVKVVDDKTVQVGKIIKQ